MAEIFDLAAMAPRLDGAIPPDPEELLRLGRLAMRIYGLMSRDFDQVVRKLVESAGSNIKRKDKKELTRLLRDEIPVLVLIHVLDRLSDHPLMTQPDVAEILRGMLVPSFSLEYRALYDEVSDPLKQVLARIDWYLDGDRTDFCGAFSLFAETLDKLGLKDPDPLKKLLKEETMPELDARLNLAFRYEYA